MQKLGVEKIHIYVSMSKKFRGSSDEIPILVRVKRDQWVRYFLPRGHLVPPEERIDAVFPCSKILDKVNESLLANGIRTEIAGHQFAKAIRYLAIAFIQDSCIILNGVPTTHKFRNSNINIDVLNWQLTKLCLELNQV